MAKYDMERYNNRERCDVKDIIQEKWKITRKLLIKIDVVRDRRKVKQIWKEMAKNIDIAMWEK